MGKWKAIAGVLLVFILGGVAGAFIAMGVCRHGFGPGMHGGPHAFSEAVMKRLDRKLDLDEGQHKQVEAILKEASAEMQEIRKEAQPRIEAVFDKTSNEIGAVLRPDQKVKFDQMVKERRERMKKRHGEE